MKFPAFYGTRRFITVSCSPYTHALFRTHTVRQIYVIYTTEECENNHIAHWMQQRHNSKIAHLIPWLSSILLKLRTTTTTIYHKVPLKSILRKHLQNIKIDTQLYVHFLLFVSQKHRSFTYTIFREQPVLQKTNSIVLLPVFRSFECSLKMVYEKPNHVGACNEFM
jgi:hypothetical protein